jgi:hypothetical protein
MDKMNHFYSVLLQENNPFFYCLDGFLFHSQASQITTGGTKDVGKKYTNDIHFCPMFYRCMTDKRNQFYLVFHKERNPPFSYCLDQILVHLLVYMARSLAIGPQVDKDSLRTGTIYFPFSICALGTRTHKIFLTTEPKLYDIATGRVPKIVLEVSE